MMSLARHLLHEHNHHGRKRSQIKVVWAVRNLSMVEVLPLLDGEYGESPTPLQDLERQSNSDQTGSSSSGST